MEEVWKDIKGYEGLYQVSNLGRVKALEKRVDIGKCHKNFKEHFLAEGISRGYKFVVLCRDGKNVTRRIHRLVAETFMPNDNKSLQVDHIDRNRSDNRLCNLRWVTKLENMHNTHITKLYEYKGETLPLYVLCERFEGSSGNVL